MRLPDPLLVRLFRAGVIDDVTKVELDLKRNVTVHLKGRSDPAKFTHLQDVDWVPEEGCEGL